MTAVTVASLICAVFFMLFTFVIMFGAPFLPTLKAEVPKAVDLLGLKKGEMLLELGCGDGRVLREAAKRGINGTGYELNPLLCAVAWLRTRGLPGKVTIHCANYWNMSWKQADGIFTFLLKPYMDKLDKKIIQECRKSVKLVSYAFTIEGKKPAKKVGALFLYIYH